MNFKEDISWDSYRVLYNGHYHQYDRLEKLPRRVRLVLESQIFLSQLLLPQILCGTADNGQCDWSRLQRDSRACRQYGVH